MLIVYDTINQKVVDNMGTNSAFPDGNIPNISELPKNQIYVRVHDNSELAEKINSAKDYDFVFDDNGDVLDVNVIKTKEQAKQEYESSTEAIRHNILKELQTLDIEIPRIVEDIIEQGNFKIHQSKIDKINRKKELRLQLQSIT